MPEGRMRCRLRVAEPFTNEKVTLRSVTRCRATPHSSAPPPPSPRRGRLTVGFCFADRDFQTASPEVYAILCSCKERLCQESTLRGFRREVRFIMSPPGKRRHNELNAAPPPENPRGTGKLGEANNRDIVQSGESFRVRGKTCLFGEPRGTKELIFLQKFLKFQETSFKKFLGGSGQSPA